MPKPRARRVPALAPARLRAFIDRLKLAKLAGREPKRAASLCPTVLLKIAGHGAPDKPAAVIPAIDRNEPPRIKVDSALRKRGHRRRRAFRRQQCQLLRIVKQAQDLRQVASLRFLPHSKIRRYAAGRNRDVHCSTYP